MLYLVFGFLFSLLLCFINYINCPHNCNFSPKHLSKVCTWSPRLDGNGNSARGIAFAKGMADVFQIHNFDKSYGLVIAEGERTKLDPRYRPAAEIRDTSAKLIVAASMGRRQ